MELHYFIENREYLTLPAFRTWNKRHFEDTVSDGKGVICFSSLFSVTSTSSGHETNQKEKNRAQSRWGGRGWVGASAEERWSTSLMPYVSKVKSKR